MTALESGDLEMRTRSSMRSMTALVSPNTLSSPSLVDHSSGVTESCSSAHSLLGKAGSLTSESV